MEWKLAINEQMSSSNRLSPMGCEADRMEGLEGRKEASVSLSIKLRGLSPLFPMDMSSRSPIGQNGLQKGCKMQGWPIDTKQAGFPRVYCIRQGSASPGQHGAHWSQCGSY